MKKKNYLSLRMNLTSLFLLSLVINLVSGTDIYAEKVAIKQATTYILSSSSGPDMCPPFPPHTYLIVSPAGAANYDFYGYSTNGPILVQSGTSNMYEINDSPLSAYCIVTDAIGTEQTNDITMRILNPDHMGVTTNAPQFTVCGGAQFSVWSPVWDTYQWYRSGVAIPGAVSSSYYGTQTGAYNCMVSNSCGSDSGNFGIPIVVNPLPSAVITPGGPTTFCSGGSVTLNAPVAANRYYQWKKAGNLIPGAGLSSYTTTTAGNYKVIVTNSITGCSKTTGNATVVTVNAIPPATVTPQGPTTFCAGGSVVLAANTGTGLTYKWKKNGNFISGATLSNYTTATAGKYKVQVTNSNGCSKTSPSVTVSVPCRDGEIISSVNHLDFTVYPNPSPGEFTIRFSAKPISSVQIQLTDETGRVVKKLETTDETLVIKESNLTKGIYCLTATNKDEVAIKKINIVK